MASISIVARPSKRADGALPLYIRISAGNVTRYVSLSFTVRSSEWNDQAGEVRKKHPKRQQVNEWLQRVKAEAETVVTDVLTRGEPLTAARIKRGIRAQLRDDRAEEPCFLRYSEELLETWRGRWAYQTYLAYRTAVRKLREWHGLEDLPFEDVTPARLRRFQDWLATEKKNAANTQHKNLGTLKEFYAQALEDEVIPWGRNPFDSLSVKKEQAVKRKLTTEELRRLRDLEIEEGLLADVRRWFLFAFYAGGMRFSDVAEIERQHVEEDGGEVRVRYRMGKTKGLHGILLIPEAVEILDHYQWRKKRRHDRVFPILDGYDLSSPEARRAAIAARNALANKYLKKLQRRAGIETPISFHLARHSCAGYLLEQGYDVRTIQAILGHASVQQTEGYLRGFKSGGPDDAARALKL